MVDQSALFAEKMMLLKKEFKANLPGKIDTITKKWQNLQNLEWDWNLFEEIYISIHKLSGASGTYGFSKVSEIASKIENIMRAALENKKILNSKTMKQIESSMQELIQYSNDC